MASNSAEEFKREVDAYIAKTLKNSTAIVNDTIEDVFRSIVNRTPIDMDDMSHRGTTKANWQIGKDEDIKSKVNMRDPQGDMTVSREARKLNDKLAKYYYIVNNEGQSNMLEYGLYPNPPKTVTGKTVNGYSSQAPAGMARKSFEEAGIKFIENVRKHDK